MAKVSIIMGVYNSEKTLNKAIDSIVKQTYSDWDFIICDDGSSDNSLNILFDYKRRFPDKFHIIHNETNMGLTYSLNYCLTYASGDYIARMDSDDISLPDRFEKELSFLEQHDDYAIVGCGIHRFDEKGIWMTVNGKGPLLTEKFLISSGFVHPAVMMRTKMLEKLGGYRDKWYTKRCEDYDLWMRAYASGYKGYNLFDILFMYYEGKDSVNKRKYKYRLGEAVTRAKGYYHLKLFPVGILYVIKPLIVGLLPAKLIIKHH